MHRPKPPAACADLDPAQVSRVLSKHLGDIPAAARELGVSIPDLRRLTWARPDLLEAAELECMGIVSRAMSVLFEALDSDEPRRRNGPPRKSCRPIWREIIHSRPPGAAGRGLRQEAASMGSIVFEWAAPRSRRRRCEPSGFTQPAAARAAQVGRAVSPAAAGVGPICALGAPLT